MLVTLLEREPGESPGLSRNGMQGRPPSEFLASTGPRDWEATAIRSTTPVRACESEDLPAVPGASRPAAHRLVEWASGRNGCSVCVHCAGPVVRPLAVTTRRMKDENRDRNTV